MRALLQTLMSSNYILEMLAACLLFALPLKKRPPLGGRTYRWAS